MFTGTSDLVSLFFQSISSELHPHVQKAKERAVAQADKVEFVSNLIPSSKVLKHLSLAFDYLSNALKIDDSVDALRKAQKKVRKELNKAEKRIFVFIDDIDRLSEKEVDELFAAIKAVGQFPYVTYLLFYDQTVVEKALEQRGHIDGKEYLKKIVQVPVRLPDPLSAQIFDVAVDELRKESPMEDFPQKDNIVGPRERAILENCLRPYMTTSRDVNRFMNEFRFRYSLIGDEVAFGDLVGITALEVFDMPLWDWIAQHKQLLSFVPESSVTELFSKRLFDTRVNQLQLLLGDDSELAKNSELWDTRKNALSVLFPSVDRALDEHSLKSVVKDEQYRFICFSNYVDSYFELEPPADRFTQKDLHSLLFDVDLSEYQQSEIIESEQFADYILTRIMDVERSRITCFLNYFF
ncbi:P-loop NTPase fold protein [Bifidobacterium sp. ESL0690]|uniref:P-loop NTPase fold protein n=1 Tax=Bifidobacterium sp. ESL0690 TaxID=2983214 RepID=UPI0023F850E8|nr:P-loop NTPase fold protein [Bifidobacterium sp. ESL0690]WEV47276.1 P-loop NTPase fold protein [Bifidobacterium sp. ESL0690]